jgi:hypothetical protein
LWPIRCPANPALASTTPGTLIEFGEFFPDELACVAYLERLRWAEGFVCPKGHVAAAPWRATSRGRRSRGEANHERRGSEEGSE